jgi:hypothetical protein
VAEKPKRGQKFLKAVEMKTTEDIPSQNILTEKNKESWTG